MKTGTPQDIHNPKSVRKTINVLIIESDKDIQNIYKRYFDPLVNHICYTIIGNKDNHDGFKWLKNIISYLDETVDNIDCSHNNSSNSNNKYHHIIVYSTNKNNNNNINLIGERFGVIIIDAHTYNTNGIEVVKAILSKVPNQKIIIKTTFAYATIWEMIKRSDTYFLFFFYRYTTKAILVFPSFCICLFLLSLE